MLKYMVQQDVVACSQIICKIKVSGLNQEVLLQGLLFSAMSLIDRQSTQYCGHRVLPFLHFKKEICPNAQKIHDNKLHSSHLNQMIKAVF